MRRPYYVATQTTTQIGSAGSGAYLHEILVGTAAASAVITVYDGAAATGAVRAVIDASAVGRYPFHGAWFKDGAYVVTSGGNAKVTIIVGD